MKTIPLFLSVVLGLFSPSITIAATHETPKPFLSKPHELRDDTGKLLGKIRQRNDGKLEGRDQSGKLKGTYDPKTNQTRDGGGRLVGTGNLLSILVVAP